MEPKRALPCSQHATCHCPSSHQSRPCPPILLQWDILDYYPPIYMCVFLVSGFPTKPWHECLFSPRHATCTTQLILLNLITLIMCGEKYKSWSSSLCYFLQSIVTSSLSGPSIFPSTCRPTNTGSTLIVSSNEFTSKYTNVGERHGCVMCCKIHK